MCNAKRPDEWHENDGDDEDDDRQRPIDADEVHESVTSGAVNQHTGRFKGGDKRSAGGKRNHDGKRTRIVVQQYRRLDRNRDQDSGCGLVGHGLRQDVGQQEEQAQKPDWGLCARDLNTVFFQRMQIFLWETDQQDIPGVKCQPPDFG